MKIDIAYIESKQQSTLTKEDAVKLVVDKMVDTYPFNKHRVTDDMVEHKQTFIVFTNDDWVRFTSSLSHTIMENQNPELITQVNHLVNELMKR